MTARLIGDPGGCNYNDTGCGYCTMIIDIITNKDCL